MDVTEQETLPVYQRLMLRELTRQNRKKATGQTGAELFQLQRLFFKEQKKTPEITKSVERTQNGINYPVDGSVHMCPVAFFLLCLVSSRSMSLRYNRLAQLSTVVQLFKAVKSESVYREVKKSSDD